MEAGKFITLFFNLCVSVCQGGDGVFLVLLQFCKTQDCTEYASMERPGVASDRRILSRIKS